MSLLEIFKGIFRDQRAEYYMSKHQHENEQYRLVAQQYGGCIPNTAWVIDRAPTIRDANEWGEVFVFSTSLKRAVLVQYDWVNGRPWHPLS